MDIQSDYIGEIALIFLSFTTELKLYHWTTNSYSRHKASDDLGSSLASKIDQFIEVLQGSGDIKIKLSPTTQLIKIQIRSDNEMVETLKEFRAWLTVTLLRYFAGYKDDLMNIRDEMVADVNKTLYLFTLKR